MMAGLNSIRRCQPLLGTYVEIDLTATSGEDELQAFASAAFAEIRRIDGLMSFHRADSELTRINREAARSTHSVSSDMRKVLTEALWLSEISDGCFDISVGHALVANRKLPDHGTPADPAANWRDIELDGDQLRFQKPLLIDLGGIAKGYAVDCALATVPTNVDACINAGGDLRMHPWQNRMTAIRLPRADSGMAVQLPMRDAALATSVGANQGQLGMIIDPHLGQPLNRAVSWSVFADSAMRADGLTKVACLAPDAAQILQGIGAQALVMEGSGQLCELGAAPSSLQAASA